MLNVTFAFVVATVLFFLFRQTRWMGVTGVFVLLCISPLFFGGLLLLLAFVYYLVFKRPGYELIPKGRSPDEASGRRRNGVLLLTALSVGGVLALGQSEPTSDNAASKVLGPVRSAPRAEVIVLRTPGGLLDVSSVRSTEMFDATVEHSILGVKLGETVPRVRVPAVYRYHVELEPEWRVVRSDGVFVVVAPRIRPTLPVAVDLAGIEKDVAGTWMLVPFTGTRDLDRLERSITARLAVKARSRDYIDRQRADARETVREFVRKWLVQQTRWKTAQYEDIRVLFADEPAGYIAPTSG